jgi:hypothetical protein
MTRFEELCKIYTQAAEDFMDYRWRNINFATQMAKGLAKYLECEIDDIRYYLPDKEGQPKEAHLSDALLIDNDTFWHYGMGVNLYVKGNKTPAMTYIFDLALKEEKDKYIVQFVKEKKEFIINPAVMADLNQVYDLIYNSIKSRFEGELEKFLKHKSFEHFPEYG